MVILSLLKRWLQDFERKTYGVTIKLLYFKKKYVINQKFENTNMMNSNVWINLEYNAKYLYSQVFSAPVLIFPLVFDIERNLLVSLHMLPKFLLELIPNWRIRVVQERFGYFHNHFSGNIEAIFDPFSIVI